MLSHAAAAVKDYAVGLLPAFFNADGQELSFRVTPPSGISGAVTPTLAKGFGSPVITTDSGGVRTYRYGSLINGGAGVTFRFDPATDEFDYVPAASDHFDFDVTFTVPGRDGTGLPITQTVTIQPRQLKNEYDLVSSSTTNLPNPESLDYVSVNVTAGSKRRFNSIDNTQTRNVEITGKSIVFGPGQANGLFERFAYATGQTIHDIENLTVHAERLVIRGSIRLPQTNVTIYARELVFDDGAGAAKIDTTPLDDPNTKANQKTDGKPGENAGSVTLNVGQLTLPAGSTATRFVLHGGNGQAAGEGLAGTNGKSMRLLGSGQGLEITYPPVAQYRSSRWQVIPKPYPFDDFWYVQTYDPPIEEFAPLYTDGSRSPTGFPSDGTNATPGGTPGSGGKGGTLIVPPALLSTVQSLAVLTGGSPGAKAANRSGGVGGSPRTAYHYLYHADPNVQGSNNVLNRTWKSRTSKNGTSWTAPSGSNGAAGALTTSGLTSDVAWLTPSVVRPMVGYVKDAYMAGNIDFAREETAALIDLLDSDLRTVGDPSYEAMRTDLRTMQNRAAAGLDYFGNPPGWTPMLSFVANLAAYQGEIDSAVRIKYLAAVVQNAAAKNQSTIAALSGALSQLDTEISAASTELEANQTLLPDLEQQMAVIQQRSIAYQNLLAEREAQLRKEAEKKLEPAWWRRGLKILGTVLKVIPVYQPALAAVGTGLTTIADMSEKPLEAISQLKGVVDAFGDAKDKLDESKQKFDDLTKSLKPPSHATDQEKLDYVNKLKDYGQQWGGALKQINDVIQPYSAPKDQVDAMLQQLKASDARWHDLVDELQEINGLKEVFARNLANALKTISDSMNTITKDEQTALAVGRDLSDATGRLDLETLDQVRDMGKRADERLLRYQYYMAKAYEYETLKPYTGTFRTEALSNRIANVLSGGAGATWLDDPNNVQLLKTTYEEGLRSIADDIYTTKNASVSHRQQVTIPFTLTTDEVAQLNSQGYVTINLMKRGVIAQSEDVVKVVGLGATQLTSAPVIGGAGLARVKLTFEHSGTSLLEQGGRVYHFQHLRGDTAESSNPILLGTTNWDALLGDPPTQAVPDPSEVALLSYLLGVDPASQPQVFYSQPGAWADITIRKEVVTPGVSVNLSTVRLGVTYTYEQAPTDHATLQIDAADGIGATTAIVTTASDASGRTDGAGDFDRSFTRNQSLSLLAQPFYGDMAFDHWADEQGRSIGTAPTLALTLDRNRRIQPVYAAAFAPADADDATGFVIDSGPGASVVLDRAADPNSLQPSDLIVTNLGSGVRVDPTAFNIALTDNGTRVTWTYSTQQGGMLPDGHYRVTIPAGSFADTGGKLLSDEITFDFDFLAGDATRDGKVDFNDLLILAKGYGQSGKTFGQGNMDFSNDGMIDFNDLLILAKKYGQSLSPFPSAAADSFVAAEAVSIQRRRSLAADVL